MLVCPSQTGYVQDLIGFPFTECPIDLSGATKLKKAEFEFNSDCVEWVTAALKKITPKHVHFEQVSIHVHSRFIRRNIGRGYFSQNVVGEETRFQWMELDKALVRLRESRPVSVKVTWFEGRQSGVVRCRHIKSLLKRLLPKLTTKGGVKVCGIHLEYHARSQLALNCVSEWFNR